MARAPASLITRSSTAHGSDAPGTEREDYTFVVSLPGMMTGQILGGVPPVEAVKYQILVMFLIAGGTGLGAVTAVLGGVYRLTDGRHRLRLDRLRPPRAV